MTNLKQCPVSGSIDFCSKNKKVAQDDDDSEDAENSKVYSLHLEMRCEMTEMTRSKTRKKVPGTET